MVAIRAHFDGSVIVPDEPMSLPPQAEVVVLVDSAAPTQSSNLEEMTRQYYQGSAASDFEDNGWGENLEPDIRQAWDGE